MVATTRNAERHQRSRLPRLIWFSPVSTASPAHVRAPIMQPAHRTRQPWWPIGPGACYNGRMDVEGDRGALTPEEGGGPAIGTAWTLEVEGEDGWSADLEHAAPLPRVGERVEFIGEDGRRRLYRVTHVVHTL